MFKSSFLPGQRSGRVPPSHGNVLNMLRIGGKQKTTAKKVLILNMYSLNLGSVRIFRKTQIPKWQANH